MTDLKCSVKNCTYNENHLCCKGSIMVDGKEAKEANATKCASFENCGSCCGKNSTQSPDKKINVSCQAVNCVYNDNKNCTAAHIDVAKSKDCRNGETECATFKM